MEIEAYFDTEQDCYIVILWKGDEVIEKLQFASMDDVDATVNLLRRHHPHATVIYGVGDATVYESYDILSGRAAKPVSHGLVLVHSRNQTPTTRTRRYVICTQLITSRNAKTRAG